MRRAEEEIPPLAIRPYPEQYAETYTLNTGVEVTIRPIRPEDEPLMMSFNRSISPQSIYLRYFHPISAAQIGPPTSSWPPCFTDYDREKTLVAERQDERGRAEILGMGQLTKIHGSAVAEFALLISDKHQRTGLGTKLLSTLLEIGRHEGGEGWWPRFAGERRHAPGLRKAGLHSSNASGSRFFLLCRD
ncbi:MAG: GNAT family N-acetyltransferase [Caldilineaceae bacterium]